MATLPDREVARSLEQTSQRLAAARHRRHAEQRAVALAVGAILLLVVLVVAIKKHAPSPPRLVITWPKPRDRQTLQPGAAVLVRPGQPLEVSVENAPAWSLRWSGDNVEDSGASHSWSPASSPATLIAHCRPAGTGWRRLVSWMYRPSLLKLQGVEAMPLEGLRRKLGAWEGIVWVYPHIAATPYVQWDERALSLLLAAAHRLPRTGFRAANGELWRLVPSFGGSPGPGDAGTYARLETANLQDDLTTAARAIAAKLPTASIKFIARLDATPPYGIIRLAFDGKADHAAWVRRKGSTAGGPLQWDEPAPTDMLSPKPPRRRRF